jgi:hypothetical protein
VIYFESLRRALSTGRGLRLTLSCGESEESIELTPRVAEQVLKAVAALTSEEPGESVLTITVQGHQVLRRRDEFGLLLRTQEFGDVIFSLPEQVIKGLIADLSRLASSSSWRLGG